MGASHNNNYVKQIGGAQQVGATGTRFHMIKHKVGISRDKCSGNCSTASGCAGSASKGHDS